MVEEDPLNGDSTDDDGELRSITDGIRPGRAQVLPTSCEKRGCVKPPYAPKTTSPKNVLKPKVQKRTSLTPNSLAKAPSPVSEAPLRASLKRVLAAEEMAPFTTKQSLEEIEELQALLDHKKSQLLRSSPSPEPEEKEDVARSALGRLTEMSRRLAEATPQLGLSQDEQAAADAALEAAEDEEVASIVSRPPVYGGSISSSGAPTTHESETVDAFTESILRSKREDRVPRSDETQDERAEAPNDKMFSSAYGAWAPSPDKVARRSASPLNSDGRQPPGPEPTFGLGVAAEDEYAPLSFRVLDDLEERTGVAERPRQPVEPRQQFLDGWRRPPSFRSFASTSPETVISSVSDYTTWSCASPRSPNHVEFTYRPPPEFVPRIRLEALRSPQSSGDLQAFSPDPAKSVSSLYSPRSAFTPRSDASSRRAGLSTSGDRLAAVSKPLV